MSVPHRRGGPGRMKLPSPEVLERPRLAPRASWSRPSLPPVKPCFYLADTVVNRQIARLSRPRLRHRSTRFLGREVSPRSMRHRPTQRQTDPWIATSDLVRTPPPVPLALQRDPGRGESRRVRRVALRVRLGRRDGSPEHPARHMQAHAAGRPLRWPRLQSAPRSSATPSTSTSGADRELLSSTGGHERLVRVAC